MKKTDDREIDAIIEESEEAFFNPHDGGDYFDIFNVNADAAVKILIKGLHTHKNNTRLLCKLAYYYLSNDDCDNAIKNYSRVIKIDPKCAEAFNGRAATSFSGKWGETIYLDKVLSDANEAVRLAPNEPWYYVMRAQVYNDLGKYADASADALKAAELDPDNWWWYLPNPDAYTFSSLKQSFDTWSWCISRADEYMKSENYKNAIADYTKAIKICDVYHHVFIKRGTAYRKQGDIDWAKKDFNRAIRLNPTRGFYELGKVYMDEEKWDDAIKHFSRAIDLDDTGPLFDTDPSFRYSEPLYFVWRGNARYKAGYLDGAKRDYEKAIQIKPDLARTDKELFWYEAPQT